MESHQKVARPLKNFFLTASQCMQLFWLYRTLHFHVINSGGVVGKTHKIKVFFYWSDH